MMYTLSYLDLTSPGVRSPRLFTVITLIILNNKFDTKCLLKHSVILDFLLDS